MFILTFALFGGAVTAGVRKYIRAGRYVFLRGQGATGVGVVTSADRPFLVYGAFLGFRKLLRRADFPAQTADADTLHGALLQLTQMHRPTQLKQTIIEIHCLIQLIHLMQIHRPAESCREASEIPM